MSSSPKTITVSAADRIRPFLKWAGGKQWLIERGLQIPVLSPTSRYFEPFLGGGSLFLAIQPGEAFLSDKNRDLIATYRAVRDHIEVLIERLSEIPICRQTYDEVRRARPNSDIDRAVRLLYLNKTAFNGIYRVNRQGEFNVPYGRFTNPTVCNEKRLRSASSALQVATLRTLSYSEAVRLAERGDIVYLDPPYVTGHNNNGFLKYNAHLFTWNDQEKLAILAKRLRKSGVHVMVSNAAHDDVLRLYDGFYTQHIHRNSLIGGPMATRGRTSEALITSFPCLVQG